MTQVTIPLIRRYELDCWKNAMQQVEDGSWVRYDDHVAEVKLMRSEIGKLEEQVAELKEKLWSAKFRFLMCPKGI